MCEVIQNHHAAFLEAYSEDIVLPKYHYSMHIPFIFQARQMNISCFVTERKHKQAKRMVAGLFGNFEATLTRAMVSQQVEECQHNEALFQPSDLRTPTEVPWALPQFRSIVPSVKHVSASSSAVLEIGAVSSKSVIMFSSSGPLVVGQVLGFLA